jgi:hypothetical protein
MNGYTNDIGLYLGKNRGCATANMTATHATVKTPDKKGGETWA